MPGKSKAKIVWRRDASGKTIPQIDWNLTVRTVHTKKNGLTIKMTSPKVAHSTVYRLRKAYGDTHDFTVVPMPKHKSAGGIKITCK